MAKKRKKEISVQKIREILRLGLTQQLGYRAISRSCSVSHVTVRAYLKQVENSDLTWDQVALLDESRLRELVQGAHVVQPKLPRPQPDWQTIHAELQRKGVTLQLLWEEYKEEHPDGYQSSQFGDLYRQWKSTLNPWMRQDHKAGDKLFVDYAGQTIPVHDQKTGEIHQAQIFVAVLGMSNYTYAEATRDQKLQNWITSHIHAFKYFGGVPRLLVPDYVLRNIISDKQSRPASPRFLGRGLATDDSGE